MSCRTTPAGSAFTTYARLATGSVLSDPAVLSCFHDLRREYTARDETDRRTYTRDDYLGLLDRQRARVRNAGFSEARTRSILERIDAAATGATPPQDVLYALHNLTPTIRNRSNALTQYFGTIARRTGQSYAEVEQQFREAESSVERSRSRSTIAGFTDANRAVADRIGVGQDVAVVAAVGRLEEQATAIEIAHYRSQPQRVEVRQFDSWRSTGLDNPSAITAAGYDPRDGRLEVDLMVDGQVQRFTYTGVPEGLGIAISDGRSEAGLYWAANVRSNPHHQYANEHEAAMQGVAQRCQGCGQFSTSGHECPSRQAPGSTPIPSGVTPRRLRQYYTQSRWSNQTIPFPSNSYSYDNGTPVIVDNPDATAEIRLPAIREFREAVAGGATTVEDLSLSEYDYSIGENGRVQARTSRARGSLTVWRDENNALQFNTEGLRCTCPEYQENYRCRHVDGLVNAVRTRLDPTPRSARAARTPEERDRLLAEAQQRADAAAVNDWTRNPETRAEAAAQWRRDSDVLYSENPEAFRADVNAALERAAAKNGAPDIPFMRENALDGMAQRGSGQAFGMEIEFEFPSSMDYRQRSEAIRRIGQELFDAGLTYDARQLGYGSSKRRGFRDSHKDENGVGNWSFENDGSVNGGELVTPGMYDEPETWQNLEKAVQILRNNGAIASKHAGAHVHVGTSMYDGSPAAYTEIARIMTQHEDVMFRLASNPERGTHRKNTYAKGVPAVPDSGFADVNAARRWQPGRYSSINFAGVSGTNADHPEFRLFDSTLDPGAMQAQIKLAVGITHAAKRAADAGGTRRGKEGWGSHKDRATARGSRRRMSDEEFDADSATTRSLLDTVFRRREDKAQLASVFAHTKWIKGR